MKKKKKTTTMHRYLPDFLVIGIKIFLTVLLTVNEAKVLERTEDKKNQKEGEQKRRKKKQRISN